MNSSPQTLSGKTLSIEGLDALVPMLDDIIAKSVSAGTTNVNIGMAHRGRLNVLAHVLGNLMKSFSEFQHAPNKDLVPSEGSTGINYGWTGDVNTTSAPTARFRMSIRNGAHCAREQSEPP
ncbi:thiamine pyrophosphate-dependent enzyme [Bacillus licheniformis]|nr:thiamine pyrophosphate-dependent enzyme [Bacillus licheniformis]